MHKSCLNCVHRLHDGEERATPKKINLFYTCDISQSHYAHKRVTLDHRACEDYSPNPFYFMRWHQVKKVVEIADKLIEKCKEEGWNEEKYYTEILNELNTK